MKCGELTSNEYYGGLNRRFDKRAARLRKLGFEYTGTDFGAFFIRKRFGRMSSIPAPTLHHADARAWFDTLKSALGWFGGIPYREG